ncbi:hypothetical protein ACSDR0_44180 [Streptosporangium sp. G11]
MPVHNHHGPVTITKNGQIIIDGRQVGITALPLDSIAPEVNAIDTDEED